MKASNKEKILRALEFTEIYKSQENNKYKREALCLQYQMNHILLPLEESDFIAGRVEHDFVGFSTQYGGIYTYYFHERAYYNALDEVKDELDEMTLKRAYLAGDFWKANNTYKKHNEAFIAKYKKEGYHSFYGPGAVHSDSRIAGINVDFNKLITLGLNGLEEEINHIDKKNHDFCEALLMSIQTLKDACEYYRLQAKAMEESVSKEAKEDARKLGEALNNIQNNPPKTFLEGLQLMWIYSICSDLMNYGRMDNYLGDLYVNDLNTGVITEEKAVAYVLSLYRHFKVIDKKHDCRIIIGGKGRHNEENADKLAMIIMEASLRFKHIVPQLTLRYYKGMNEEVLDRALYMNAQGLTFPMIYSDETNIENLMKIYDIPYKEAVQYVPFGCGEFVIVGKSTGTPNTGVNLLKNLEITLHNGKDYFYGVTVGKKTGEPEEFDTFQKLYSAFLEQLKEPVSLCAAHDSMNYQIAGEDAPFLLLSLLMADCIERQKGMFEGGVKYVNASSEVFGIISCADSLTAIKQLVYEEKRFTLKQLVHILDNDFIDYESEREELLNAPKYGNDIKDADNMAYLVFEDIANMTMKAGKEVGFHSYSIVSVNNSGSAEWGYFCEASACGRRKSSPMSNGNGASIGGDKSGVTSLLNSMRGFDNTVHVGVINNIRFTKELFDSSFYKLKSLIVAFLNYGGVQLNITAINKDDLEKAVREPEKYQDLLVRIGGFSARFVELEPAVQKEIMERTTYEA